MMQFKLDTIPNKYQHIQTEEVHKLALPQCCPVSKNPRPGSTITIRYFPRKQHLEAYCLERFVNSFVGGLKCPHSGAVVVRQQEEMIQFIAQQCALTVGAPVTAQADLVLDTGAMTVTCRVGWWFLLRNRLSSNIRHS